MVGVCFSLLAFSDAEVVSSPTSVPFFPVSMTSARDGSPQQDGRSAAALQDQRSEYSIILQAPQKYQRMMRAFYYQDFEKIRSYCKPTLRIESYGLLYTSDKGYLAHFDKKLGYSYRSEIFTISRDSKRKKEIDYLNRKFQDFLEGIVGRSTEISGETWLPSSGQLDIMPRSGFGYECRPCAGYYARLQIDPEDSKHPICGWFETVR